MKLMLQIAGGVVLGWIAIAVIKGVLSIGAISAVAQTFHSNPNPLKPPTLQHNEPAMPAAAPAAAYPSDADPTPARKEHDAPAYTVRKATAEDAAAKPAR